MKNRFGVVIIILIAGMGSLGWEFPQDAPFTGLEEQAAQVKRTVFSIQIINDQNDYQVIGTGFLVLWGKKVVGVTAAHVIKDFVELQKKKPTFKEDVFIGLDTSKGFRRIKFKHRAIDIKHDIAVLTPKTPADEEVLALDNWIFKAGGLGANELITEGKGLIIVGYPLGLGIAYNRNYPLVKLGIVAQYTDHAFFLVDASANQGNSGSPVFSLSDGKLIGMVSAIAMEHLPVLDQAGEAAGNLTFNSGLALAVTADKIKEVLETAYPKQIS